MKHYKDFSINYEKLKDLMELEGEDHIKELLTRNWEEVENYQDEVALVPDWDKYLLLEELGLLGIYTVRRLGELVGYAVIFADYSLHFSNDVFAKIETIYIQPEHRKFGIASQFIDVITDNLTKRNASVLTVSSKAEHSFNKLLAKKGFTHLENLYGKLLKGN